ncbi:glycosyltransferase family 4 protein [Sphingomonas colocasiae]|uniref:Glycosyltransferase family 4 protein n=1 Tax=Sphingomonas colocasiae TaxID=1848973 RepID=A0ABS7PHM0_9SPHN|nr:glycosyltransferase family 1 protein [Sphingomonas colocasiae]MBY8820795.1 glycosyltransferase family 4 protein [Sphingomonas colocasiae]
MTVRVLLDHYVAVNQYFGGISKYLGEMVSALPPEGVDPTLFAPLYINHQLATLPPQMVWGKRLDIPLPTRKWASALAIGLFPIATRLVRPDVVHETYYAPRRLAPAKIPIVLTVHDMIHEIFPEQFVNDPARGFKRTAINRADHIICVSQNTRRDLIQIYPHVADRITVIPLGFAARAYPSRNRVRDRPYIFYVGNRSGYKNFESLLRAYAQSERLRSDFDLVCGGKPLSAAESAMIKDLGLSADRVVAISTDDAGLHALYANADIFVYPSLYEGFGIPPLEAMAADCPVVTVGVSSIPEICGNAVDYAEDGSPEALASAIERVLASPSRCTELRQAGRLRLEHFSWQRCAAETAGVYRQLSGKN